MRYRLIAFSLTTLLLATACQQPAPPTAVEVTAQAAAVAAVRTVTPVPTPNLEAYGAGASRGNCSCGAKHSSISESNTPITDQHSFAGAHSDPFSTTNGESHGGTV